MFSKIIRKNKIVGQVAKRNFSGGPWNPLAFKHIKTPEGMPT
jgi:hypothetical protein